MGAQATRLSEVKVKAAKPKEKDYILTDGDGLQMRVRANGSKLWNFNYIMLNQPAYSRVLRFSRSEVVLN